ncbi:alpha/beta hydrolase fold domain-containing protein [Vreelandella arcis]|uniref:Acetyl esterase n=1 Tax=Vreelandella arcis TaxID=416873 RepID=A0A1G9ZA58_9GAMM|nr:alpha/beta hydrolase fold domain-containing protein [Halomonas arcis]SDN17303.1 acetyl esterase [Halomonas arcis]
MDINAFIARFEAGLASIENIPLASARTRYDRLCQGFAPPTPAGMKVCDEKLESVTVRHFIPTYTLPGYVLFIHGGGFTMGSVESHHGIAASLAQQLKRRVVSINYRLAPEASYRGMLADCLNVANTMKPLAVVGDSAGGRLAMDLAPLLNHTVLLGLIYPPVNGLNEQTLGADAPLLSREDVMALSPLCPQLSAQLCTPPPAAKIEVLAVEYDPLTLPLEEAVARWHGKDTQVGYRCAKTMVHAALHAHAHLPEMQNAWQDFCQALNKRLMS